MHASRRAVLGSLSLALTLAGLSVVSLPAAAHDDDSDGYRSGMVFTSSNALAGNELLVYARGRDGALTLKLRLPTGGQGSDAGLGSQGAVTISGDGRYVFVVNAQSNTVTTFALRERSIERLSTVASGGLHPISVTEHDDTVYVLNDAGEGNVAGFRNVGGELRPLAGSVRGLSVAGGAAPAQVGFSEDGDALVVTEKNTHRLTTYPVRRNGAIDAPIVTPSPGRTPFGFAFNRRNRLLVTEAGGGAAGTAVSSYRFGERDPARPIVVSASVADTQVAACWIAVTPNGRHAFAANTGSSTVSSFRVTGSGEIALIQGVAGSTGAGSAPADAAVSADGRHLYVRNGRTFTISSFTIGDGGALSPLPLATGLPTAAVGIAAN